MKNENTKVAIVLKNNQINEIEVGKLPSIIADTLGQIEKYDSKIEEALKKANNAKSSADSAAENEAGRSVFKDKKKIAIETLQAALIDTCEAQDAIAEALGESFEIQKRMSNAIRYLFGLGCMNMAANRMVVRELEMRLKCASEEELSELAIEELNKVLFQLKAQQDLLDRVEKHKEAISDLRAKVNEIENKCEESKNILRNAEKSFCELAKEKESILDSKKQNLEKCMDEFKHEFKEEKKSLRKMWFWMILGCISISSIISYVIVTLCK